MASDVTRILTAIEQGDAKAEEELLPLVYEELRRLAAQKLSEQRPGEKRRSRPNNERLGPGTYYSTERLTLMAVGACKVSPSPHVRPRPLLAVRPRSA